MCAGCTLAKGSRCEEGAVQRHFLIAALPKPLPFRGGVGVGLLNLGCAILTRPTPGVSPEGEGR